MKYDVTTDPMYTSYNTTRQNQSPLTKEQYRKSLTKICKALNTTLTEMVNTCKKEQDRVTEKIISHGEDDNGNQIIEKEIIRFDVNGPNSSVKKYFNDFIKFCQDKDNKNKTINNDVRVLKTFLKFYDITLPKIEALDENPRDWFLLSKEDLKYIINDSSLPHASLIKFLQSTGMRLKDALTLTINDFMIATKDNHNFVDVDDFIDNAPDDMIGVWEFYPSKTQRNQIPCITCNDPETSNLILQNLRRIKNEYLPKKNKQENLNLTVSKSDALFGSKTTYYKGHLETMSISSMFNAKNKKLREYRIKQINERIIKGELSAEDYEVEVGKIPKFHAHGCRKYFETMISRNCGDLRLCALMEGHASPIKTDSSYIKKSVEEVKEVYLAAIPDLSLENTETKVYSSEVRREMESKIKDLEQENKVLRQENDKAVNALWDEINNLKERQDIWNELKNKEKDQ